jgi:hypothetical protein
MTQRRQPGTRITNEVRHAHEVSRQEGREQEDVGQRREPVRRRVVRGHVHYSIDVGLK